MVGSSPRARGTRGEVHREAVRAARFIPASAGNTMPPSRRDRPFDGSSPRARGTLSGSNLAPDTARFIPASAGNTRPRERPTCRWSVHPRERGEHQPQRPCGGARDRFIPASAGNTASRTAPRATRTVHPRERGEHAQSSAPTHAPSRFIPASAGNTLRDRGRPAVRPVHPRERGEHTRNPPHLAGGFGSSPRARGTLFAIAGARLYGRFIPASAGNTPSGKMATSYLPVHPREQGEHTALRRRCPRRPPVHPRERGEHPGLLLSPWSMAGSSPRARGTHTDGALHGALCRFIPASAGNTAAPERRASPRTVHPRERGEHCLLPTSALPDDGSSPRARGTRRPTAASCRSAPVHPRERGEHLAEGGPEPTADGSSPRARGTRS